MIPPHAESCIICGKAARQKSNVCDDPACNRERNARDHVAQIAKQRERAAQFKAARLARRTKT